MASFIPKFLRQLRDVVVTSPADEEVLAYDSASGKWVNAAAVGGGVTDHGALTGLADNDHPQYQLAASAATDAELAAAVATLQPIDSDLTAIAALSTTAFGRSLLVLANQAALLSAAGAAAASHAHAGEDVTSGTVADARIASTIARDSEVAAAITAHEGAADPHPTYMTAAEVAASFQPLDSDLTAIAALSTTAFGRAVLAFADEAALKAGLNLEAGTDYPSLTVFNDHSARHEDGGADEISIAGLAGTSVDLAAHIADATAAHAASAISVTPFSTIAATTVQAALEEIVAEATAGAPTNADYLVGTANGGLSAEIVVGTSPGGELGGTWASPTVDATHSGSSHAGTQAAAEATAQAALDAHTADTSAAHAGSAISVSSTTLSGVGTDVQAVFEEIDNLLDDHSSRHEDGGADEISLAGLSGAPADTINKVIVDAKGDLLAGTAADTIARLAVGSNTQVLTADSTQSTGMKWAAAGGGAATKTVNMLTWATRPDDTSEAFFEAEHVNFGSNDIARGLVLGLGSALAAAPTVKHGVYGAFRVPVDYASAANLGIVWAATLTSGDVVFDFDYRAISDDESLDQATWQEAVTATKTADGTARERDTVTIDLTDGNLAAGDTVLFFFGRDGVAAADTMAGRAYVFDVYFEYST